MWPFPQESAHPLLVHFPIALLLTGVGLDVASWVLKRPSLQRLALWNLALGVLAAAVAVGTGLRAERVAKHSFEIWQVIELHKRLGITTLILGLMAVSWRLKAGGALSARARTVTTIFLLVMTTTLLWGAHLGGRLVYEFGVGGRFGQ